MQSTTTIAFDQHAATTVAAVLLPEQRQPALHSLTSESATILKFVARIQRQHPHIHCCYEAGPCLIPAWHAQQRLYRRYQRLAARGKPKQHVVTAIARELTGFVWATLAQ